MNVKITLELPNGDDHVVTASVPDGLTPEEIANSIAKMHNAELVSFANTSKAVTDYSVEAPPEFQ